MKSKTKKRIAKATIAAALVTSSISTIAIPSSASTIFNDLNSSNIHYNDIINLAERGIINGFPDGTYRPNAEITRGQAAKIIAKTLNLDTTDIENPNFTDVNIKDPFYPYIAALVKAGIISGYSDKTFKPSQTISRGQMAKMIAIGFNLNDEVNAPFTDVSNNHPFVTYINALYSSGVTTGKTTNTFDLNGAVTRGQLASFVVRAENAVTSSSTNVSGVIEKITKNYLTVNGTKYKINTNNKFLSLASNGPALTDAQVSFSIENGIIQTIKELQLTANAEKVNFQNAEIESITLPASIELLKDVTAKEIIYAAAPNQVKFEKVHADFVQIQKKNQKTASLINFANEEDHTVVTIYNSSINELQIDTSTAAITNTESIINSLTAMLASTLNLNGQFQSVHVPNNIELLGTAQINEMQVPSRDFSNFRFTPTIAIQNALANDTHYSWTDIINNYLPKNPSASTGSGSPMNTIPSNPDNGNNVVTPPAVTVDTSVLQQQISIASSFIGEKYTSESFAQLQMILAEARAIIANSSKTQDNVNVYVTSLISAINSLVFVSTPTIKVDKSNLNAELQKANAYVSSLYTEETFSILASAIVDVKAILKSDTATQAQVDMAILNIKNAISSLVKAVNTPVVKVDKSNLNAELHKAKAYVPLVYTEESYKVLTDAIVAAQMILDNNTAIQSEVDAARTAITNAIGGLVNVPSTPSESTVDTSGLVAQINGAKAIDSTLYTADSYKVLTDAIDAAQMILDNNTAIQSEVDATLTAITNAIGGLVKVENGDSQFTTDRPVIEDNKLIIDDEQYLINNLAQQQILSGEYGEVANVVVEVQNNIVTKIKKLSLKVENTSVSLENAPAIEQLTVTGNVENIQNINAEQLIIHSTSNEVAFDNVTAAQIEVEGSISSISGAAGDQLIVKSTSSSLYVKNVESDEIVIDQANSNAIAKRSLLTSRTAANTNIFGQNTTSTINITFDGNYEDKTLTIKRSQVVVDTNADAKPFSTIDIQNNDVTINAAQLANVSVAANVLRTSINADVKKMSLDLQNAIEISSASSKTIGELLITAPSSGTNGWISLINISLPTESGKINLNNGSITAADPIFLGAAATTPATFAATAIRDGYLLGKVLLNVDNAVTTPIFYKLLTANDNLAANTNVTAKPSDAIAYTKGSSITVYNDVTNIVLYTGEGANFKIAQITPPFTGLVSLEKTFDTSTATFKINTTYRNNISVQDALQYFVILKENTLVYSDVNLTGLIWKENTDKTNYIEITIPRTINGVTLNGTNEVYLFNKSLNTGGNPSSYFIPMLKQVAKIAQTSNKPEMIRTLLSTISATTLTTFDSLFLKNYIDELVANEDKYSTVDDIKKLLENLTPEYSAEEIMTTIDLLLESAPLSQFEYSTAGIISNTVADGKLVFTALKEGSTTLRVQDASGNATLVSVTVDANKKIERKVLAVVAPNGTLLEGNDDFRYVQIGGEIKIVATKLQNALAIIQTNKTDSDLLGTLTGVYVSTANGAYTMTNALDITPSIINFSDLGLPNGVTALTANKVGGITLESALALYPRIVGTENIVVSDGANSTALTVKSETTETTAVVNQPEIAKATTSIAITDGLKLEAIKTIEKYPTTTNVHLYNDGSTLHLFANGAASGSFIVKDIQDKSAIINFQSITMSGKVTVPKFEVVKTDLSTIAGNSGATIQDIQGSSLRASGSTLYAVAAGTTQVTLSNGKQYSIEVKVASNQYSIDTPQEISNKVITANELHMSNIESATTVDSNAQLYLISNKSQLIVSLTDAGTSTIVLKSNAATPEQTIIHVTKTVDAQNEVTYTVEVDRTEISATDLGLNTLQTVTGDITPTARAVVDGDKLYIYGFQSGKRTFKVSDATNTSVVNVNVANTAGNYTVEASPVTHNVTSNLGNNYEIDATTFSSSAAHLKGDVLYATGNGLTNNTATIEVPIVSKTDSNVKGFYTVMVSYNEATGRYTFEDTGVITFKATVSKDDLGLTSLKSVIVPTGSDIQAAVSGNQITISLSSNEESRIQVIGNEGTADSYIYVKRDVNGLVVEVEKSNSIDVSSYGLNAVTTSSFTTPGIIRENVSQKNVQFFALNTGTTAITATDANGKKILVNATVSIADVTVSNKREITANVVSYDLSNYAAIGETITGTIIEGDAIRIDNGVAYAVKNGATAKVLLASNGSSNGKIVQFTVSTNGDTHYEMDRQVMTNSTTITADDLGLTGNLTATGHNAALLSKTEYGSSISVYGLAEGTTSLVVTGANNESTIVNFTITKNGEQYEVSASSVAKVLSAAPVIIDPSDANLVRIKDNTIYALAEGTIELLVDNEVKQITISKVNGQYTMSEPVSLGSAIYSSSDLGFNASSGLTIEAFDTASIYATVVTINGTDKVVGYSKLTGLTTGTSEFIVKSSENNLRTLVQVSRKLDGNNAIVLNSAIAVQGHVFTDIPEIQNGSIARYDAAKNMLYLLDKGFTYATVDTDIHTITVSTDTVGQYKADIAPLDIKTGKTIAALPGNGTDASVIRLDTNTGIIYATGIGQTKVLIDGNVYNITVSEATNGKVTMFETLVTSQSVTAAQLGLNKLTSASVLNGNANAIQFVRGDGEIVLYSNGASTAQTLSLLVEGTIGDSTTKFHAVLNVKIAEDGTISEAKEAVTTVDNLASLGFNAAIDEVIETDEARAVWKDGKLTVYALKAGNTAFNFTNGFVNANVSALQTNLLQSATPTFVSTPMTGDVDSITNGLMLNEVTVDDTTTLYAKQEGTALVNVGTDVYSISVAKTNGQYVLTKSAAMKSVEFDIGTGTVAPVGTVLNGVATAVRETTDTNKDLVIYATDSSGVSDIMITSADTTVKTLYHTTVTNGVPSDLEAAKITLPIEMTGATIYKGENNVRIDGNELYLLAEEDAVLKLTDSDGDDRLINVTITRKNGKLTATAEFVKYTLKEVPASLASSNLKLDGTTLYAINDTTVEEKTYSTNYRFVVSTVFEDGLYKLKVEERNMKAFNLSDFGLTATTTTIENTPSGVAYAEVVGDRLIIYAGSVFDKAILKVQDTIDNKTTTLTFNVTNNEDGSFIVAEQANVNALLFADMSLTSSDAQPITVVGNSYNSNLISVTATKDGLNVTSKGAGTTSILLEQNGAVVGIVNVIVESVEGNLKATLTPVSINVSNGTLLYTTNEFTLRQPDGTNVYYPTATGSALFQTDVNSSKASFVMVTKNAQTGLYSAQVTEHNFTTLNVDDLDIDSIQSVEITGSAVTKQISVDNKNVYLIGQSTGITDVKISDGTNFVMAVANNGTSLQSTIAKQALTTDESSISDWSNNEFAQVRGNTVYALKSGKTVLTGKIGSTDVLMNVSISRQSNLQFTIAPEVLKATFNNLPTLVDATSDVIKIVGNTVYAQKQGIVQIVDGTEVKTIAVTMTPEGQYKLEVSQPVIQKTYSATDLGIDDITSTDITALTGSGVISAKIAGESLVVLAKNTGEAQLSINGGKTLIHFAVTEKDSKLVIEDTFASKKIEGASTISFKSVDTGVVRFVGNTIYALKEGSLILSIDGKLYNVSVAKVDNKLSVDAQPITAVLAGIPTENVSSFMTVDDTDPSKVIAYATDFTATPQDVTINGATYRITITTDGVMSAQKIEAASVDITAMLPGATTATSASGYTEPSVKIADGKTYVELNPKSNGHEIVTVTNATNTQSIQLSVTVTGTDTSNLSVTSTIVSDSYNFSHFGFYATSITDAKGQAFVSKQGVIQVNNGIVKVYPGEPGTAHVTIKGNEGKQALYVLTVAANGSFTFTPFTSFVEYNNFNFIPTAIAQSGTASAIQEGEGLRITYIDTNPTVFVVRGETAQFKTVYAQATVEEVTNQFVVNFTKDTDINEAYTVTTEVADVKGNLRTVKHTVAGTDYTIVYATTNDGAKGSFTTAGKIFTTLADSKYTLSVTELKKEATVDYSTAEHKAKDNVVTLANGQWQAIAPGTGIYKMNNGDYVQMTVVLDPTNNFYEIQDEVIVPAVTITDATNLHVLKGDNVFVDGNTVLGFTNEATSERAIIRATKAEQTALYSVQLTNSTVNFEAVQKDIFSNLAINSYEKIEFSNENSAIIRIAGDKVYALSKGTELVTITTKNGLRQQLQIEVSDDYEIIITPLGSLGMNYSASTDFNLEQSGWITEFELTFTEAIHNSNAILVKTGSTASESSVTIKDNKVSILSSNDTNYTATFDLVLDELTKGNAAIQLNLTRSNGVELWEISLTTASNGTLPVIEFQRK